MGNGDRLADTHQQQCIDKFELLCSTSVFMRFQELSGWTIQLLHKTSTTWLQKVI